MMDEFHKACRTFNITPKTISFDTTPEVYKEMVEIAKKNDCTLEQLFREITDDFLLRQPE